MDGRIYYIEETISQNFGSPWTVRKLAVLIGLSAPHFQKLFREKTGIAPMAYLQRERLDRAGKLLETTLLSVKQIRIEVGIVDASHFTRDFKRKFGCTPTEFRRQNWRIPRSS